MSIIEREIEKREALIRTRAEMVEEAETLKERVVMLEKEAAEIDVATLQADIDELKGYLINVTVQDSEPSVEVATFQ